MPRISLSNYTSSVFVSRKRNKITQAPFFSNNPLRSTVAMTLHVGLGAVGLMQTPGVQAQTFTSNVSNMTVSGETVAKGSQVVLSGGSTIETLVSGSGTVQYVSSGGYALSTIVGTSGGQYVYSGGVAQDTVLSVSGTTLGIAKGGIAIGAVAGSGTRVNVTEGILSNVRLLSGSYLYLLNGTILGGQNYSGIMRISGGTVSNFQMHSGQMFVSSGVVSNLQVYGGNVTFSSGVGVVGKDIVLYGGEVTARPTITLSNITLSGGGNAGASGGGTLSNVIASGGAVFSYDGGGLVSTLRLYSGGVHTLRSTGILRDAIVYEGGVQNTYGAFAPDVIVSSGGSQAVYSSGLASATVLHSSGNLYLMPTGSAVAVDQHLGGAVHTNIIPKENVLVSGKNVSGDFSLVSGVASNFILYNGVTQTVSSAGSAYATDISSGASQRLLSSTYAQDTNIFADGTQFVSGGAVRGTTVHQDGTLHVSYGTLTDTQVSSGGDLVLYAAPFSSSTTIQGRLQLQQGAQLVNGTGSLISLKLGTDADTATVLDFEQDIALDKMRFTGTGGFLKQGTGALVLTQASDHSAHNVVSDGSVVAGANNALGVNARYTVDQAGTLDLGNFTTQLASVRNDGVLKLESREDTGVFLGHLEQGETGTLSIQLKGKGQPLVQTDTANLAGTIRVDGYSMASATTPPVRASDIVSERIDLIHSKQAITGGFGQATSQPFALDNRIDFLTDGGLQITEDRKTVFLGNMELAWLKGGQRANRGSFTLEEGATFEVDVSLADQTDFGADWDGKTLTKKGAGTLILSADHTYTGGTDIQDGTVQISSDHHLGASTGAVQLGSAQLHITDSIANQRELLLVATDSTIATDAGAYVSWDGSVSGSGGLQKSGTGTLSLGGSVDYTGDTVVQDGQLVFAGSAHLQGGIQTAQTVVFDSAQNIDVQGSIEGLNGRFGNLQKRGTGTVTLTGNNSLNWEVLAGSLRTQGQNFQGDMTLGEGAVWAIGNQSLTQTAEYQGYVQAHTQSTLIKEGAGAAHFVYGSGSVLGNLQVQSGSLVLSSSQIANVGIPDSLTVQGNVQTKDQATLELSGQNSYLDIRGGLEQSADATLRVALDLAYKDRPDIQAQSMQLGGRLEVTGFAEQRGSNAEVVQASALEGIRYALLGIQPTSDGVIEGQFANQITLSSSVDYLMFNSELSADKKTFYIDQLQLAWNSGDAEQATGHFTLAENTAFDVDTVLSDQSGLSGYSLGWDGRSLNKYGQGKLVLSEKNTYTGATVVHDGLLVMGTSQAIAQSEGLHIEAAGRVDLNGYQQTVQNLSGTGTLSLGNAELVLNTSGSSESSQFAGTLQGEGQLTLQESDLTLKGDLSTFTGTIGLNQAQLTFDGESGGGKVTTQLTSTGESTLRLKNGAQLTGQVGNPVANASISRASTFSDEESALKLEIDSSSQWKMNGSSQVEALTLEGRLEFAAPETQTPMLELHTKNWQGQGGTVVLNTFLEGDESASDKIVLQAGGQATGNTFVEINRTGGLGGYTKDGILIVDASAGAQTEQNAFTLKAPVESGAFLYDLHRNADTQSWYLKSEYQGTMGDGKVSMPNIRDAVFQYGKSADILSQQGLQALGRYDQRPHADSDPDSGIIWTDTQVQSQVGGSRSYAQALDGNVYAKGTLANMRVGADWYQQGGTTVGNYLGLSDGSYRVATVNNPQANGSEDLTTRGMHLGVYGTHQGENYYVDASAQWSYYGDITHRLSSTQETVQTDAQQGTMSLEVGAPLALTEQMMLIPQAQVLYQTTKINDFSDGVAQVQHERSQEGYLRLGMRLENTFPLENTTEPMKSWASVNVWHPMSGRNELLISDGSSQYQHQGAKEKTWAELNLGVEGHLTERTTLFTEVGVQHTLEDSSKKSFSARAGIRMVW